VESSVQSKMRQLSCMFL